MQSVALAPLPVLSTEVCDNASCREARTPRELCTCTACVDGAGHGIAFRVVERAAHVSVRDRITRTGDVLLGAGGSDDELVPVAYRGRTLLLDAEDIF